MYFDGSSSKEGSGKSILLFSLVDELVSLMHMLELKAKNNIVEYEALVLGLRVSKVMKIKELVVFGGS